MNQSVSNGAGRILVVDDAPEVRILVRGVLEGESYHVTVAETGAEAIDRLRLDQVDLVLLDLDLPDVQGTTLCRQLRDEGLKLPIVMLTCHNQGSERAAGLDCGADDYIGKPFLPEELLARVRAQLRREARMAQQVESLLHDRWERINDGLRLAQRIQQPLNGRQRVSSLQSAVRHIPVGRIGGDFYILEDVDEYRSAVAIGDTMGKGVGASLVMSWAFSAAHELMRKGLEPGALLNRLNGDLGRSLDNLGVFVAFFFGLFDRRTGEFRYASAGCEPPIWIRRAHSSAPQRRHTRLTTGGVPVGVDPKFEYSEGLVHPSPGDQLFLFTDGLTESVPLDRQGALTRQLYRVILQSFDVPLAQRAETLLQCLRFLTNDSLFLRDDLTFLLLEFPDALERAA